MKKQTFTKEYIFSQLEAMGAPRNSIVLVHSSLKSVGETEGGAEGLLDAFIEYFTSDGGLLCIPTHTWDNLKKEITLDVRSPENCLGAFSTVAASDKRGYRTENPTHSMVIFGDRERAEKFADGEKTVETPTSPDSCYGGLFREKGYVLLVGVAHNRNTYLHSVAEMLGLPNRMEDKIRTVRVKRESGEVCERRFSLYKTDYTDDISRRFVKYETAFRYHGCIRDGFIGNAPTQLCDAKKMKDTVELIWKNSCGKDPLSDEEPIEQRFYCVK